MRRFRLLFRTGQTIQVDIRDLAFDLVDISDLVTFEIIDPATGEVLGGIEVKQADEEPESDEEETDADWWRR